MKRSTVALLLLTAMAGLGVASSAVAHGRSVSYSSWELDDAGARVRARISRLELTRLGLDPAVSQRDSDRVGELLVSELELTSGGRRCTPVAPPLARPASEGWVVYSWRLECPDAGELRLTSRLLLDVAPTHLHFARASRGGRVVERVLSEAEPSWLLEAAAGSTRPALPGTSFSDYLVLGVKHILSGWDHLAFVMALLLLAASIREVAGLVTGFTVAHSVTLGLAALGVVRPEARVVEALIGFSIALVAAENAWLLAGRGRGIPVVATGALATLALVGSGAVPRSAVIGLMLFTGCHFALLGASLRPARLRVGVAFAFGLVHGFGFAGVLEEMSLPAERLVPALFGFNLGVELGQLAVVALIWPLLRGVARWLGGSAEQQLGAVLSAGICGLGLYWFVVRSFA